MYSELDISSVPKRAPSATLTKRICTPKQISTGTDWDGQIVI